MKLGDLIASTSGRQAPRSAPLVSWWASYSRPLASRTAALEGPAGRIAALQMPMWTLEARPLLYALASAWSPYSWWAACMLPSLPAALAEPLGGAPRPHCRGAVLAEPLGGAPCPHCRGAVLAEPGTLTRACCS